MKQVLSLIFMLAMGLWSTTYLLEVYKLPKEDERITVQILFAIFVFFFVIELISQIKKLRKSTDLDKIGQTMKDWLKSKPFVLLASFAALVILAKPLGFFTSCFIFMVGMIYYLGGRKIWEFLVIPATVAGLTYFLFDVILAVPFPANSLLF